MRSKMRITLAAVLVLVVFAVTLVRWKTDRLEAQAQRPVGVPAAPPEPACEPIELSGVLRRPAKASPQLELAPAGGTHWFAVTGPLLKGIPEGTPLYVKGVVRSYLHLGSTANNVSAFPPQWHVSLRVTELQVLDDPLQILRRRRGDE